MRIAIGADHAGWKQKDALGKYLRSRGHRVIDMGTRSDESVDYPDFAAAVARAVGRKKADRGILVCGTGIGMAIAANKVKGVRAAPVWSNETARLAAEHNAANVLALSGRLFPLGALRKMTEVWLKTPFGEGRHARRIKKISALDRKR